MEIKLSSKQFLTLPLGIAVHETRISYHWMQEGIFYCVTKGQDWSMDACNEVLALYAKIGAGKKIDILVDASQTKPMPEDIQQYYTRHLPLYVRSCAILTTLSSVQNLTGPFMKLSFNGFATRMFNNEQDARHWLNTLKHYE